jgi:hypothetical protein
MRDSEFSWAGKKGARREMVFGSRVWDTHRETPIAVLFE